MGRSFHTFLALTLGWLTPSAASPGSEIVSKHRPVCAPGHKPVEALVHQEVVKYGCKLVPDVKKVRRTVYTCKEEPFCLPRCSLCAGLCGHRGCADCGHCEPPRLRRILVKREIVEEVPSCKCIVETLKELVPVKVFRQAPCVVAPLGAPQPIPGK